MSNSVDTPLLRKHFADASKFMDTEAQPWEPVPTQPKICCVYFPGNPVPLRRANATAVSATFTQAERERFNRQTNAWAGGQTMNVRRKAPKKYVATRTYKRKAKAKAKPKRKRKASRK